MSKLYGEMRPSGLPCPNSSASFWHSQPNKQLLGHCTTDTLPSTADIVVVGSGITGSSIARWLAEDARSSNLSIVMLEAREACWGATGMSGLELMKCRFVISNGFKRSEWWTLPATLDRAATQHRSLRDQKCRGCAILHRKAQCRM